MADRIIPKTLRAALAAAAMLGLAVALAPGHAEDAIPVPAPDPAADPAQPRFEPAAQPAENVPAASEAAAPAADLAAAEPVEPAAPEEIWQPVGSGVASWYGSQFAGRRTASGERFDPGEYTAAHRTLPFGSRVRVTGANGRSVVVRINDRGPFARGRVIDVSQAAARDLGLIAPGHGTVTLAVLTE